MMVNWAQNVSAPPRVGATSASTSRDQETSRNIDRASSLALPLAAMGPALWLLVKVSPCWFLSWLGPTWGLSEIPSSCQYLQQQ